MFAKVVSSNGIIALASEETEKEIILENQLDYLSIIVENACYITLNDDVDKIYLPIEYTQPFILDKFPVYKFKIEKYYSDSELQFSYYGFY